MPDSDDAQRTATEAAAKAQTRTSEYLLAVRLEQLRTQARPEPVWPVSWAERLPELAACLLDDDARPGPRRRTRTDGPESAEPHRPLRCLTATMHELVRPSVMERDPQKPATRSWEWRVFTCT
ncbi:hypothetical protein SSCG_02214 [Streptomyces clavuligerus]|nr:hypothetical protein SSCG_02214 [Streptomyces clavuligerus]